jgi:MFS family permease
VVLGTLIGLFPFAQWMAWNGRRSGFRLGIGLGLFGSVLAMVCLSTSSFWLFSSGHLFIGLQQGAFQYLRFTASEIVPENHRSRGISLVMAGGVIAAFLGPWLAYYSRGLGIDLNFGLAYGPLVVLYLVLVLIFAFMPGLNLVLNDKANTASSPKARPLWEIIRQPAYLQALLGSAIGYALMILLMTATPLAMDHEGHSSQDISWIIQWHVLGMFVPSFFTGSLIKRFGHRPILTLGIVAIVIDIIAALFLQGLWSFWASLLLLGIGWNFLYITSTSSLTRCYRPEEKEKAQAAHDIVVFSVNTVATYGAASLLTNLGWVGLHAWTIPLLALTALGILLPLQHMKKKNTK